MKLTLTRPLIFFDLETTGLDLKNDRIVEICVLKLFPGKDKPEEYVQLVNPERPIPAEATAVHHLTDADVENAPKFAEIAAGIAEMFADADIAGFNSVKFDLPMLGEEMTRARVVLDLRKSNLIDVQNIFHKKEPRNLVAAYRFYCNKDLTDAHSALADTRATYEVFLAQLEKYDDLPADMKGLAEFTNFNRNVDLMGRFVRDNSNRIIVNFGRYKGTPLKEVLEKDRSYGDWILSGDFPMDTKQVVMSVNNSIKK